MAGMTNALGYDAAVDFYEEDEPADQVLDMAYRPPMLEAVEPVSVLDVAAAFLRKFGQLDTYKLQKLCYYAQAQHLAMYDTRLFKEPILAWPNGPVVKELFARHAGKYEVDATVRLGDADRVLQQNAAADTLEFVGDRYGFLKGQELSELTHREQPWRDARVGLRARELGAHEIPIEILRDYYRQLEPPEAVDDPGDWWQSST